MSAQEPVDCMSHDTEPQVIIRVHRSGFLVDNPFKTGNGEPFSGCFSRAFSGGLFRSRLESWVVGRTSALYLPMHVLAQLEVSKTAFSGHDF
jgi:hypothetical protein